MKTLLNTLYVTTQGAYLAKDGEAVAVRIALRRIPCRFHWRAGPIQICLVDVKLRVNRPAMD